jgi:hypothetical protein
MLIELLLNDSSVLRVHSVTFQNATRYTKGTGFPSYEYFHPFVNVPSAHIFVAILNYHYFVNFHNSHKIWPQNLITDRCYSLELSVSETVAVFGP